MNCSLIGGVWVCISQGRLLAIPRKLNSKELPEERCIFTPITMKQVERVGGGGEAGRWWRGWEVVEREGGGGEGGRLWRGREGVERVGRGGEGGRTRAGGR